MWFPANPLEHAQERCDPWGFSSSSVLEPVNRGRIFFSELLLLLVLVLSVFTQSLAGYQVVTHLGILIRDAQN
jgi:hypothetical protein